MEKLEKNEKKKHFQTKIIAEVAILAAFAVVLDILQSAICRFFPLWPNGGSIGIAMVPIMILAYRRGTLWGLLGGLIVGILDMLDGVDFSPLASNGLLVFCSVMLDYVLGWTAVGLAGLVGKFVRTAKTKKKLVLWSLLGAFIAGSVRFLCHFLSGYYLWEAGTKVLNINLPENIPGYLYSLLYNMSYILPSIILCMVVIGLLLVYQAKLLVNNPNFELQYTDKEEA